MEEPKKLDRNGRRFVDKEADINSDFFNVLKKIKDGIEKAQERLENTSENLDRITKFTQNSLN